MTARGSVRRRPSVAQPKSFVAIAEDHGDLFTVWQTCLLNDSPLSSCPRALYCHCERHESGPTLMAEVRSYETWEAALAAADALNEPLLFDARGRAKPPQERSDPPASRDGAPGDGYRSPLADGGFIDEDDVPF